MSGNTIPETRAAISDEESIRNLLGRFIQLRDDGKLDEWSTLYSEDARFSYAGHSIVGRAGILEHTREHFYPPFGRHLCVNSVITVDGDRAEASSDFVKIHPLAPGAGSASGTGFEVAAAGRYQDRLVRENGTWRIADRRVEIADLNGARVPEMLDQTKEAVMQGQDRPALLVVTVEVAEEDVDELNAWYDEEHRAEKLALPGYIGMRRFRAADGSPKFLATYELTDPTAADVQPGTHHPSDWMQRVMKTWKSWERSVWVEISADAGA